MNKNWSATLQLVPVALMMLAAAAPAHAQGTRQEQLAMKRAEKAKDLHAYIPDRLERRIERVTGLFNSDRPFYPYLGGVYEGGSFAVGPGIRARFADSGNVTAYAARSLDGSSAAQAVVTLPSLLNGRLSIETAGNRLETNTMHFYGTGNRSADDRFDLAYRSTTAGVTGRLHLSPRLEAGAGADAVTIRTDEVDPNYARTRVYAKFDSRKPATYARSGGLYRVDAAIYHQVNEGTSSFRRLDAEASQFIPIFRDNWVIALRARASAIESADGQGAPFFLLPSIGGGKTLRGYPSGRYRDNATMVFTAEYRWTAGQFLDMSLFVDAGRVAPHLTALSIQDLSRSYGIGATLHSFDTSIVRLDVARTAQGARVLVSFNPGF
ncbi:MAG: BamA/TamA family outer membrane protein [Vicinamibacterales bacterium]